MLLLGFHGFHTHVYSDAFALVMMSSHAADDVSNIVHTTDHYALHHDYANLKTEKDCFPQAEDPRSLQKTSGI
jgi:hypothetical protein